MSHQRNRDHGGHFATPLTGTGFLERLCKDVGANTLAITAAAMIPLIGVIGGGVDLSRMYIVKTRLQHACDAGALAGRKAMGGGTWTHTSNLPNRMAERFFNANIQESPYGATSVTKTFTENAGKVTGAASAALPMTLMGVFGHETETLNVTCDAEMRLPNTDVMFVLDVTGSMAETIPGDTRRKIDGLKTSVKCFYEIVARLDTNATCSGDPPSGGTGDQVQIRFGFVPYSVNVNVGRLLPTDAIANEWKYQSREPLWKQESGWEVNATPPPKTEPATYTRVSQSMCNDEQAQRLNTTEETQNGNQKWVDQVTYDAQRWESTNGGTCHGTKTTTRTHYVWKPKNSRMFNTWRYAFVEHDISKLKNGTRWNDTVSLPIGTQGAQRAVRWDGCIEERKTVRASNYSPIPTEAFDLDIDKLPNPADPGTQWGPMLPGAIYTRRSTGTGVSTSNWNIDPIETTAEYTNTASYYCPVESRKLQGWPLASTFQSYVDALAPTGNTYHDIGLIWGARLISPTGLFRSENEYTPQGGEIERHVIFMTDGDTVTQNYDYTAYGVPWFDRRQTAETAAPSQATLNAQLNSRFSAVCTAVKNMQITLWVISFGDATNQATRTRLENCATSGRYFQANDSNALQATFRSIADEISQLRLTQ